MDGNGSGGSDRGGEGRGKQAEMGNKDGGKKKEEKLKSVLKKESSGILNGNLRWSVGNESSFKGMNDGELWC